MKEIPVIIKEWDQPIAVRLIKKGRPAKGQESRPLKLERLPNNFYIKLARLNKPEIENLLQKFQFLTVPDGPHKDHLIEVADVLKFQEELALINKHIGTLRKEVDGHNKFNTLITAKLQKITSDKSGWSLFSCLNIHLQKCHIVFSMEQVAARQLSTSEIASYKKELLEIEAGENSSILLKDNVLNTREEKERGGNMSCLAWQASHLFSWCVLNLLADKLIYNQRLHNCRGCQHIYIAKTSQQRYCEACTPRLRGAERARRMRASKK